jgi:hypothetical protein
MTALAGIQAESHEWEFVQDCLNDEQEFAYHTFVPAENLIGGSASLPFVGRKLNTAIMSRAERVDRGTGYRERSHPGTHVAWWRSRCSPHFITSIVSPRWSHERPLESRYCILADTGPKETTTLFPVNWPIALVER